jgi:hypothetical protein
MADLTNVVTLTLQEADVCDMLTKELCGYGPLDALYVSHVSKDVDGTFNVILDPKPEESTNG